MSDLNSFSVTGRLGKDAETKAIGAKGTLSTEFSLANDTGFGQYAKTSWIDVRIWGQRGASVQPYLKKGTRVAVTGSFTQNNWVDQNGIKHTAWRLEANDIVLIGGSQKQAGVSGSEPAPAPDYGDEEDPVF